MLAGIEVNKNMHVKPNNINNNVYYGGNSINVYKKVIPFVKMNWLQIIFLTLWVPFFTHVDFVMICFDFVMFELKCCHISGKMEQKICYTREI